MRGLKKGREEREDWAKGIRRSRRPLSISKRKKATLHQRNINSFFFYLVQGLKLFHDHFRRLVVLDVAHVHGLGGAGEGLAGAGALRAAPAPFVRRHRFRVFGVLALSLSFRLSSVSLPVRESQRLKWWSSARAAPTRNARARVVGRQRKREKPSSRGKETRKKERDAKSEVLLLPTDDAEFSFHSSPCETIKRAVRFMLLSRVIVASAAAAKSISSATRRIQTLSLHRRSPFLAMSHFPQQRDGEAAEPGGDRRRATTSTTTSTDDDVRSSKKALRSSISATLKALSDEEMARQSELLFCNKV